MSKFILLGSGGVMFDDEVYFNETGRSVGWAIDAHDDVQFYENGVRVMGPPVNQQGYTTPCFASLRDAEGHFRASLPVEWRTVSIGYTESGFKVVTFGIECEKKEAS
jgi:hypothetical protein